MERSREVKTTPFFASEKFLRSQITYAAGGSSSIAREVTVR